MNATTDMGKRELDAYRFLHANGWIAFEANFGEATADQLVNRWADARLVRISWANGGFTVQTFKEYATDSGR